MRGNNASSTDRRTRLRRGRPSRPSSRNWWIPGILLIGWLIAKGVSKAVQLLLTRTGFPKLIDKSGLGAMMSRASFDATG